MTWRVFVLPSRTTISHTSSPPAFDQSTHRPLLILKVRTLPSLGKPTPADSPLSAWTSAHPTDHPPASRPSPPAPVDEASLPWEDEAREKRSLNALVTCPADSSVGRVDEGVVVDGRGRLGFGEVCEDDWVERGFEVGVGGGESVNGRRW